MQINFTERAFLKKYNLKYETFMKIKEEEILKNNFTQIKIGWNKDNFELYMGEIKNETGGKLDEFFSSLNKPFNTLIYQLSEKGEILDLLNYMDILEKWENLKTEIKIDNEDNQKLFFKFTGLVNNKEICKELTKRFFIIPYLFIGFYNQELKQNTSLVLDRTLYNIYGVEDIDVRYKITDGSQDENEKIVILSGKENPNFDRSSFIKKVQSSYPEIPLHKLGGLDLKCSGKYVYSLDNTLKYMEFSIDIEIIKLMNYKIIFKLEEIEENGL